MNLLFVLLFLPIIVAVAFVVVLIVFLVKALSSKLSKSDINRKEENLIKIVAPSQAKHRVKDIRLENDSEHYAPISGMYRSYPVVTIDNIENSTQAKAIKLRLLASNERITSMRHAYYPPKESFPKMEVLNVN